MHRVEYKTVKSLVSVLKKSNIVHNIFVIRAIDLKTNCSKPMKNQVNPVLLFVKNKKQIFFNFSVIISTIFETF